MLMQREEQGTRLHNWSAGSHRAGARFLAPVLSSPTGTCPAARGFGAKSRAHAPHSAARSRRTEYGQVLVRRHVDGCIAAI